MFKTPQDYFKSVTDFYSTIPKTQEDTKAVLEKVQKVFETEYKNSQDVLAIYQKAATGNATINEITSANKKASELFKASTFASVVAIPGALFVLPAIIEKAKELNIDFVPKSVSTQFGI